jgi:hypothetical protein
LSIDRPVIGLKPTADEGKKKQPTHNVRHLAKQLSFEVGSRLALGLRDVDENELERDLLLEKNGGDAASAGQVQVEILIP